MGYRIGEIFDFEFVPFLDDWDRFYIIVEYALTQHELDLMFKECGL